MENDGTLNNNAWAYVGCGSQLANAGTVANTGSMEVRDGGTASNYGTLNNSGSLTGDNSTVDNYGILRFP